MVGNLVHRHADEITEHQFGNRAHADQRGAGGRADDRLFCDRGRADAFLAPLGLQPGSGAEHTTRRIANVFTQQKHARVGRQRMILRRDDRLIHRHGPGLAGYRRFFGTDRENAAHGHIGNVGIDIVEHVVFADWFAGRSESDSLSNFGCCCTVDFGKLRFAQNACIQQQCARLGNRPIGATGGELLLGQQFVGGEPGMGAKPQRNCLDKHRTFACAHIGHHFGHDRVKCGRVIGIHAYAPETKRGGAAGKVGAGGIVGNPGVFADLVVLAHENDRQPPCPGQVHGFMNCADAGGAVAKVDDRDAVFAAHLRCQRKPVGNRRTGANNCRCQHRTAGRIGDMWRSAFAFVETALARHRLGKQALERYALGNLVVNAAIDGDHVIVGVGQRGNRCRNRLLAGHRPVCELETARRKPGADRLVHLVNARHLAIDLDENIRIDPEVLLQCVRRHGGSSLFYFCCQLCRSGAPGANSSGP